MMPDDELAEAEALWREFDPDLVVVEDIALSQLLTVAAKHSARTVIDLHNIDSRTVADQLGSRPLWQRLRGWRHSRRKKAQAREADRLAAATADQVWVCSSADAALLSALGPANDVRLVANPIPDESVLSLPISPERYRELRLLFIGHLGYFPNVDAVKQIGRKMVPTLAASGQPWSIIVAGRNPGNVVRGLCTRHGLQLIENPPHLAALLERAGYAPIPLRLGGGTRIKVLEAMAAGLIVCATEKAVEGLGLQAGRHFLSGSDAGELASKTVQLARRPEAVAEMAQISRDFVHDNHSATAIDRAIREAVAAIPPRHKE
jgi:glycosyltransferase involved in cell wall biosynthesis